MARTYGGILGLLAFQTILARGWLHGSDPQSTLWYAWLGLMLFAAVGLVVGAIAKQVVEDAVAERVSAELAAQEKSPKRN